VIPPDVESQIGKQDHDLLVTLVEQLAAKQRRNSLRSSYYDMHNLFRDLGIAIPPQLRRIEVAMGWPAKAVNLLAQRVRLNGFVIPGGDVASWGIPQMWRENHMETEFSAGVKSALIHSPAFIATTLGDVASGEPEVVFTMHDATTATGLWDWTRRSLSAVLLVMATDDTGEPSRLVLMTPTVAHGMTRGENGASWDVRSIQHRLGRVPVEPLRYNPNLSRPFGTSRISRAVMAITDSAMRTVVRSEVGAEFYSAPQRYLLGADEQDFVGPDGQRKNTWDLVMGRILAVGRDEDGEVPTVGQFPQISMQPHTDHLRMWATMFAGETGLPVSSLGIVQDNPSSAEAIYAGKEDLVIEAENCADWFGPAILRAVTTGVQMRDNLPAVPDELASLGVRWRDPSTPSRAAATDAVMKQIAAGVLPPDSEVALEQLGYDETTIARVMADRRRAGGSAALRAVAEAAAAGRPVVTGGDAATS
jgi:hypothetical protein